jgi:uncharacterized protein (TIGR00290 family)
MLPESPRCHGCERMILSWSGGKDSALALWALRQTGALRVDALVTTVTTPYDRISMHGIRRSILHAQAISIGVPVVEASLGSAASNDDYERVFIAALEQARAQTGTDSDVAFGDLFLRDVREYRERLLANSEWSPVFPLWLRDTNDLATEFIAAGFRAILCCVDTQQLSAEFAGREFDENLLRDLPASVDPCGERGEFHTCVYAGPIFSAPLMLVRGERVLREDRFEYCDLLLG